MITTTLRGHILPALMTVVVCCSVAGCGSGSGPGTLTAVPAQSASAEQVGSDAPAPIDACALISADDITALLGVPIEGQSTTVADFPDMPGCVWENPANSESVTLEIGNTDSAINGTVPEPRPGEPALGPIGPDGMIHYGAGAVQFAAGHRLNDVSIAVLSMAGDEADAAATDLANKVSAQLS